MCNTFWDILYFALTRTQTTKLALKNALHFTSHSLKLASSEKTSKSKVCGTQQQEDACYLVYLIINTTFIILWNKIGFSWKKWESGKQGPEDLLKDLNDLKKLKTSPNYSFKQTLEVGTYEIPTTNAKLDHCYYRSVC